MFTVLYRWRLNPELIEAYELLVGLYEKMGQVERAFTLTEQVLQRHPENRDMLAAHARLKPLDQP